MSWHTIHTTTTTQPGAWYHYSEMVVPMSLVLHYRLLPFYILDTCFTIKPRHPT